MTPPEPPTLSEIKAEKEQSQWDSFQAGNQRRTRRIQDRLYASLYASRQISIDISVEFRVI